ncbi:MAG: hypothetical protein LBQ30_00625 [Treponema sp.]|jgi:hypothetical protein|nr:hypothetical protein [Treponema sp.]
MNTSKSEKMSLPVSPVNYIYAQFKHVSGVHAPEGVQGVPIVKLKILDILIDRLQHRLGEFKEEGALMKGLTDDRIDALIAQYEHQIRQSTGAGMAPVPYRPAPAVPVGVIFDLVA